MTRHLMKSADEPIVGNSEKIEAAIEAAIKKRIPSAAFDPADITAGEHINFYIKPARVYALPWAFCSKLDVSVARSKSKRTSLTESAARVVHSRCIRGGREKPPYDLAEALHCDMQ